MRILERMLNYILGESTAHASHRGGVQVPNKSPVLSYDDIETTHAHTLRQNLPCNRMMISRRLMHIICGKMFTEDVSSDPGVGRGGSDHPLSTCLPASDSVSFAVQV